mmetsp:Transcript_30485/g.98490  ORF Transcript_30485/g.98490 Transcript_30485/m.98490 type:complete len:208 (-) Transcript_30485:461-1084(-)
MPANTACQSAASSTSPCCRRSCRFSCGRRGGLSPAERRRRSCAASARPASGSSTRARPCRRCAEQSTPFGSHSVGAALTRGPYSAGFSSCSGPRRAHPRQSTSCCAPASSTLQRSRTPPVPSATPWVARTTPCTSAGQTSSKSAILASAGRVTPSPSRPPSSARCACGSRQTAGCTLAPPSAPPSSRRSTPRTASSSPKPSRTCSPT